MVNYYFNLYLYKHIIYSLNKTVNSIMYYWLKVIIIHKSFYYSFKRKHKSIYIPCNQNIIINKMYLLNHYAAAVML